MPTVATICNMGLSHLGNRARVASISPTDGSTEADYCATFYPVARDELLEMFDWDFARKRAALVLYATNDSAVWTYAYRKPSDCLVPRRILTNRGLLAEQDSEPFLTEGVILYANRQSAMLAYTMNFTDASKFPPSFATTLGYLMAAYLSGPIIKGSDGAKAAIDFRKIATAMGAQASASNANRSETPQEVFPSLLAARHGIPDLSGDVDLSYPYASGYAIE